MAIDKEPLDLSGLNNLEPTNPEKKKQKKNKKRVPSHVPLVFEADKTQADGSVPEETTSSRRKRKKSKTPKTETQPSAEVAAEATEAAPGIALPVNTETNVNVDTAESTIPAVNDTESAPDTLAPDETTVRLHDRASQYEGDVFVSDRWRDRHVFEQAAESHDTADVADEKNPNPWQPRSRGAYYAAGTTAGQIAGAASERAKHESHERRQDARIAEQQEQIAAAEKRTTQLEKTAEANTRQSARTQTSLEQRLERLRTQAATQELATTRASAEQRSSQKQETDKTVPRPEETPEQAVLPADRRLENSSWHRIEIDKKTGKVAENPTVAYGQEFNNEIHQEQLRKQILEASMQSEEVRMNYVDQNVQQPTTPPRTVDSLPLVSDITPTTLPVHPDVPKPAGQANWLQDLILWIVLLAVVIAIVIAATV